MNPPPIAAIDHLARIAATGYKNHMMRTALILIVSLSSLALAAGARAQDKGALHPRPLPPLAHPDDPKIAAKEVFGREMAPAKLPSQSIGFYAKGCLAGGQALPINGPGWQVMRLSRNRNWGNPHLIAFLEKLAAKAGKAGWPGLLVGDMSQPRGGPMFTGHASHQVGLDADIWLTPMPDRLLSRNEREEMSAIMMVRPDRLDIDPKVWTPAHLRVIRAAAEEPQVERIFVNAAIKKALCRDATGNRHWLSKIRPMYGHDYHFHIRLKCPGDSSVCEAQTPPDDREHCEASDFAYWFSDAVLHPKPPKEPPKPKPPITVAELPAACRQVLAAP